MKRLDPAYRANFADGSTIHVRYGHEAMREEIAQTCGSLDAAAFDDFVDWLRKLYQVEMPNFIDHNFDSPLGLLHSPTAAAQAVAASGRSVGWGQPSASGSATRACTGCSASRPCTPAWPPTSALALYAVITYMDSIEGVYFPDGRHARSAAGRWPRRPRRPGPRSATGTGSSRSSGPATAGWPGSSWRPGEQLMADAVVCTIDLPHAYETLVKDLKPPRAARNGQYSPSAVVWHIGVRGVPEPPVAHHNIHFGEQWGEAFDFLLKKGELMPDPSRLVTVPSLDESDPGPRGLFDDLRARAGAQPERWQDRLADRRPGRCGIGCTPSWVVTAIRARS